jgi:hypothetical protein
MSNQCYWKGKVESSSKKSSPLCNRQQTSQSGEGLVNRGQNQIWHGVGVESSSRKSSPPPKKNFSPPSKQPEYLAAPFSEKMRKTPVAYPWNPLVALGMEEANWWQPRLPNSHLRKVRNFARVLYSLTTGSLAFSWPFGTIVIKVQMRKRFRTAAATPGKNSKHKNCDHESP